MLADWPMPNSSVDVNRNGILDDIVIPRTVTNDRDNFDVKLTWQRNNQHSIWAKFGMLDAEVVDNFILGFDQGSLGDTRIYVGTIGHTWTLSPTLVLDGNFGINRMEQTVTGPDYGNNVGTDRYGIPGTNGGNVRASGMPFFDTTAAPRPQRRRTTTTSARRPTGCRSSAPSRASPSARRSPR